MAHEQSETIPSGSGYRNVYGSETERAGQPIPPQYPFEKTFYSNKEEAVGAAIVRSELADRETDNLYLNRKKADAESALMKGWFQVPVDPTLVPHDQGEAMPSPAQAASTPIAIEKGGKSRRPASQAEQKASAASPSEAAAPAAMGAADALSAPQELVLGALPPDGKPAPDGRLSMSDYVERLPGGSAGFLDEAQRMGMSPDMAALALTVPVTAASVIIDPLNAIPGGGAGSQTAKQAAQAAVRKTIKPAQIKKLAEDTTALLYEHGGSTVNPVKGNMAGADAYAVAAFPELTGIIPGRASQKQIKEYIDKVSTQVPLGDERFNIGSWFNKEQNRTELDVSVMVGDRQQATRLATAFNQIAITDLRDLSEVKIGGSGVGQLRNYSTTERLAMVKLAQHPIAPAATTPIAERLAYDSGIATPTVAEATPSFSTELNGHGHPFIGTGKTVHDHKAAPAFAEGEQAHAGSAGVDMDPQAVERMLSHPDYPVYQKGVQDATRATYGDAFPVYRAMDARELADLKAGKDTRKGVGWTTDLLTAKKFADMADMVVNGEKRQIVESKVTPDAVMMRGEPKEKELVLDPSKLKNVTEGRDYTMPLKEAVAKSQFNAEMADLAVKYGNAPAFDPEAAPLWDALIRDTESKYDDLSRSVKFIPVEDDSPYKSAAEMFADADRGQMKVSVLNNEHPLWSPEQNFKFRAVHDYFGHYVPKADFTLQGEDLAYREHARLVVKEGRGALDVEVRGQAAAAIAQDGKFQTQKVYIPGKEYPAPTKATPQVTGAAVIARDAGKTLADFKAEATRYLSEIPADDKAWKELYKESKAEYARYLSRSKKELPSTQRLLELMEAGDDSAYDWYHAVPAELQRLFGDDWRMFAKFIAATSPQSTVAMGARNNLTLAMDAYKAWKTGGDFGGFMPAHRMNLERAAAGLPFNPTDSPKVFAFDKALAGDPTAITMDGWMAKIFNLNFKDSPKDVRFAQEWVRQQSERLGIAPRDMQAALWAGKKFEAGLEPGELVESLRDSIKRVLDDGSFEVPKGLDESGKANLAALWLVTRAMVGASAGATFGDDTSTRIKNALIGAGLGAIASPRFVMKLTDVMKTTVLNRSTSTGAAALTKQEAAKPLSEIAQNYRDLVAQHSRGERSHEVARADAAQMLAEGSSDRDTVMSLYPGATLNDAEIAAMTDTLAVEADKLQALAFRVKDSNNDPRVIDEFVKQLKTYALLDPRAGGVLSETGRSLAFLQSKTDEVLAYTRQFGGVMRKLRAGQSPERMAEMVAALRTPEQMAVFSRQITKPGMIDMALEAWINGLLSGFKTTTTNLVSNTYTLLSSVGERALASYIPGAGGVVPGEAGAMIHGYIASVGDAFELAWRSFKEDVPRFGNSKLEPRPKAITAENLNVTGPAGRLVDGIGNVIRVPGRALMAEDEFFKAVAYRGEIHAQAQREAYYQASSEGLTGKAFSNRVRDIRQSIIKDPLNQSADIQEQARQFATYTTFTKELGEVGQNLQAIANHPAGRIIMPFVRAPLNIFKYAGERTPFALVSASFWKDIQAGGATRDLALAKLSMGSGAMAIFASIAASGAITGSGPGNPEVKAIWRTTGRQPYSINMDMLKRMSSTGAYSAPQDGDTWVSYSRTDPAGMLIGLAADFSAIAGHLGQDELDELATRAAVAISNNMTSKTYVKGVAEVLHGFSDPERAGKKPIQSLVRSIVPAAVRQFEQVLDPTVRETRSFYDMVIAQIPGLSTNLKPSRNFWGEAVSLEGGLGPDLISPFYTNTHHVDPVTEELVRLGIPLEPPADKINGVQLSPEQYDRYRVLFGKAKFVGGRTIHKQLAHLMQTPLYKQANDDPEGLKFAMIQEQVRSYKVMAQEQLKREDPMLAGRIGEGVKERIQKLTPGHGAGQPSIE